MCIITTGSRQSKMPILSRTAVQKSIETVFFIAICRLTGDKWQSKTPFLSIFDPHSSIVDYVFYCCLPGVIMINTETYPRFLTGCTEPLPGNSENTQHNSTLENSKNLTHINYIALYQQGSYKQGLVKFKDFSRTSKRFSYGFQGLKTYEKY